MKIGLVLDDTLDTSDGVQQYVLRLGGWLSSDGHDVHYLVGATSRKDVPNIHSLSRNKKVSFNGNTMSMPLPTSRKKLRSFLAREQFDVLHVQVPYSPFLAGQILLNAPQTTAPIGTFHILPYSRLVTYANFALAILNHRSGKRFETMLAVSKPAADFAKRIYGYNATVIPNPVEIAQFKGAKSDSKTTNILFLGRLVERKGAGYLLEAIAALKDAGTLARDVHVYIGGKGSLLPDLQRFVSAHGLGDVVTFSGFISETDKADFLAQADIAVYPSLGGESFGIVLLEGMAAARGVVLAGDNPGYRSVMPNPTYVIDPRNTDVFADTLLHWLRSKPGREAASKEQKKYVEQFDIQVVGKDIVREYEQILQTHRQS